MKVAAVQAAPVWMDASATAAKTVELIREAAAQGVAVIVFGDSWLSGYPWPAFAHPPTHELRSYLDEYRKSAVALDGPELELIAGVAAEHDMHVVLGVSEQSDGQPYSTQLQISPDGQIAAARRRPRLTALERHAWRAAPEAESDASVRALSSDYGRIGTLAVSENLTPDLQQRLAVSREQIHAALWPAFCLNENAVPLSTALPNARHYAIENQCYVVLATHVTTAEVEAAVVGATTRAQSIMGVGGGAAAVFGPAGERLSAPIGEGQDGLAIAEIDVAALPSRPKRSDLRERGDRPPAS